MIKNLSLNKKFIAATLSFVILAIALLTIMIIRHETNLMQADNIRNAEILATTISKAIKDNMLIGRPSETIRLIRELSGIKGVEGIGVLNPDGNQALGMSGPVIELGSDLKERLLKGDEVTVMVGNSHYLIKPLMNEKSVRPAILIISR
jgi:hypothetical protein